MDKQVAKLIARIAENLPEMSSDIMQGWIENPKSLKNALHRALCPPNNEGAATWERIGRLHMMPCVFQEENFEVGQRVEVITVRQDAGLLTGMSNLHLRRAGMGTVTRVVEYTAGHVVFVRHENDDICPYLPAELKKLPQ